MTVQKISQAMLFETTLWAPRLLGVVVIILVYFVLIKILKTSVKNLTEKFELDAHLSSLLVRASRVGLIVIAFVSLLGTLGINVMALVAGLGLTGFAIGFALKDTISNLLSGILLLLYQPFEIGDTIKVLGYEGEVTDIDLRYTNIESHGSRVLIPNAKLFTDPITVLNVKSGIEK